MENWEKVEAVQSMQTYILNHLAESISLYDLAQAAQYSPWHSARIFKDVMGKTPFEYIRQVRLSQAALKLRDEQPKIIDVAFDFVFDSHEGFTRAFSKQFGLSPHQYRKTTPPINLFMPYPIRDYYRIMNKGENQMKEKTSTVFVQVIERPARKLILKRGFEARNYFEYCEEVDCEPWGILTSIKEALYEPCGMWLPQNLQTPGTSEYVQGVEVPFDYNGVVPEGFDLIDLKPCKMMVFQGEPFDEAEFEQAIYDMWNTIKKYSPELYGYKWANEDGPRFQLEPRGYRGYIEAKPVRLINE